MRSRSKSPVYLLSDARETCAPGQPRREKPCSPRLSDITPAAAPAVTDPPITKVSAGAPPPAHPIMRALRYSKIAARAERSEGCPRSFPLTRERSRLPHKSRKPGARSLGSRRLPDCLDHDPACQQGSPSTVRRSLLPRAWLSPRSTSREARGPPASSARQALSALSCPQETSRERERCERNSEKSSLKRSAITAVP